MTYTFSVKNRWIRLSVGLFHVVLRFEFLPNPMQSSVQAHAPGVCEDVSARCAPSSDAFMGIRSTSRNNFLANANYVPTCSRTRSCDKRLHNCTALIALASQLFLSSYIFLLKIFSIFTNCFA